MNQTIRQHRGVAKYIEVQRSSRHSASVHSFPSMQPKQPEPCQFCATERDEESPALLGIFDAFRAEFGPDWPVWLALYIAFVAAGVTALVAIVWSAFK